MRLLAELLQAVEAETPYGGQAVSYEPLGCVWLRLDGEHDASEPKRAWPRRSIQR